MLGLQFTGVGFRGLGFSIEGLLGLRVEGLGLRV